MKYKVIDVSPGQIEVEYEDESTAIVPVPPFATLSDIDHEVSKYDPDLLKKLRKSLIGQERVSRKKENSIPNVDIGQTCPERSIPEFYKQNLNVKPKTKEGMARQNKK
jgi:hypothetical protein